MMPNCTWFFTQRLAETGSELLVREIDLLRDTIRSVRAQRPFEILAAVVLPDALHMIWDLPPDDLDHATRWTEIKTVFVRHVPGNGPENGPGKGPANGLGGFADIWHPTPELGRISNAADLANRIEAIHQIPVLAGLCPRPQAWPFSSIHRVAGARQPLEMSGHALTA